MKNTLYLFTFIVLLFSCKTDFEVNAPYDQVPIVYGLLNASTDTQFIKINRSFLGEDNISSAQYTDSSQFKNVTARVEQYTNGNLGMVYNLQEKWITDYDDGLFYSDSIKIFYFVESNLDKNSTYKIVGSGDGKSFSAETNLVGNFSFNNTTQITANNGLPMAIGPSVYGNFTPKWTLADKAGRYDITIDIFYEEHKTTGIKNKRLSWFLGTVKSNEAIGFALERKIEGESFYQFIANNNDLADLTDVNKRVIKDVNLKVTAANNTFNTYMEVNRPISSIITERPEYTNITGGLGLFASRDVLTANSALRKDAIQELAEGALTGSLLFCTDSTDYTMESYYCP